ncbi:hypothetical protein BH11VER1_BH11VER1_26400 [soil metagenome]
MNEYLAQSIESAQRTLVNFVQAGFGPARLIDRQLVWCWKRTVGLTNEELPGPLCLSYLAQDLFEKYGDYPLLAQQLRSIEAQMADLMLLKRAA